MSIFARRLFSCVFKAAASRGDPPLARARASSKGEGRFKPVSRDGTVVDEVYAVRLHQVAPEEGDVPAEGGQRDLAHIAPCAQVYLSPFSQFVVHFEDDIALDHS